MIAFDNDGKTTIDTNVSFIDTSNVCITKDGYDYVFQELTTAEKNSYLVYVDNDHIYNGSLSGGGRPKLI